MFKVQLLSMPACDLAVFRGLIPSGDINGADASLHGPVEKFSFLADSLLFAGTGHRHLFYGLYFELPITLLCEIEQFQFANMLRLSTYNEGLMVKGIVTTSLDIWKEFIKYGVKDDASNHMNVFCKAILKLLPLKADPELRMIT